MDSRIDSGSLNAKGAEFNNYAQELTALLGVISADVETIESGAMQGSAVVELANTYDGIKKSVEAYISKIDALGTTIINTANQRTDIDSDVANAAKGTAV